MDDRRGQFTFYRSFWEAISRLPKKDKLPVLEAVISYALDGASPSGLSNTQSACFLLMKPNLDSARKKAANGKQGGSKPKANRKQTESKKENEEEKEKEVEIEGEKEKEKKQASPGQAFTSFWSEYPVSIGRENAWEAWKELNPDPSTVAKIMESLGKWKASDRWAEDGGRFIPRAAKFLTEKHWMNPPAPSKQPIPKGASGELGEAELEAIRRAFAEEREDCYGE